MTPEARPVYVFGEFRLDPANRLLERAGEPLTIHPKAFQLLLLLVENAGSLVRKEQLLEELWPDVVVQENNLTQQMSLLRRVMGEGEWIETVPRVGYKFIGQLRWDPPAAEAGSRVRRGLFMAAIPLLILAAMVVVIVRQRAAPKAIRSIAVLPLRVIGEAGQVDHLRVGIADAIIYQLSALRSIEVRPTSAVQKYGGTHEDVQRAARELDVDAVLEGTLQRSNDRLRIRVQLVDVRRNAPVFSGKFDEPASDLFAVEDAVAGAVARALSLEMTGQQVEKRRSRVPGAYEEYLKGRYQWSKRTPEGLKESIARYEEAIGRDPSYAAAYAALGESLNLLSMHRVVLPDESFPRAREAAAKALSIDDTLADAHVALGTAAFYYEWDWAGAERHLRRAIVLDPQIGSARHILANLMAATGRGGEAVETMQEAIRHDPMSITLPAVSAYQFYLLRRHEEGIRQARKALDRDSGYAQAYKNLAFNYLALGRYDEGVTAMERYAAMLGPDTYAVDDLACAYASHPSRRAKARAMRPQLLDLLARRKVSPYDLAIYHAALGDRAETIQFLEETMARHDPGMVWIGADPRFDKLRSDPQFKTLLQKMKL